MRWICLTLLFVSYGIDSSDDLQKYRLLGEQCSRTETNSECLKLKSKFLQLIEKCQKFNTQQQQILLCQEVKTKLCTVFPSACGQTTTKSILPTKRRTRPKTKLTTSSATTTPVTTSERINNEEFVKVPINPEKLRERGEYCIRHGKEKNCQQLLNNLKNAYSSCKKKNTLTTTAKPDQIDCHSFGRHLCQAFPKFPPCIKKGTK